MGRRLRVLIVEDVEEDVLLVVRELERAGYEVEWRQVETRAGLGKALAEGPWDIVLADYMLGGFTAPEALEIVRRHDPDLPFIVVSGSTGDQAAVDVMRAGAQDYFRKERIALLAPAVARELREARGRRSRRRTEAELRLVTRALEASAAAVVITDREGSIVWTNPAFTRLTGYDRGEAVGQNLRILKSGRHPEAFYRQMWETILGGQVWHGEVVNRRRDGSLYAEEMTITPVMDERGEITHFVAVKQDVTTRREMERRLRESEERFRVAFRAAPDAVNINRLEDGLYVDVNESFLRISGYRREEVIGRSSLELSIWADPADRARLTERLRQTGEVRDFEARFRMKDGSVRIGLISAVVTEIAGVPHILSITRDITEQKEMERRLRESEERYRRFFDLELTGNFVAEGGRLVDCNRVFLEMFGFESKDEALAVSVGDLYPDPGDRERFLEKLRRERVVRGHEGEYRRRDGSTFKVLEGAVGIFDQAGNLTGVQGFLLDLSERERLEAQLRQAQKLESVGRLAAGVAHDFNNMLQAMENHLELLRRKALEPRAARHVAGLVDTVDRARRLTRQLLAFTRQQTLHLEPVELNELLADNLKMLNRLVPEDIGLALVPAGRELPLLADSGRIGQVVLNLVVNAVDATPPGGKITLETRHVAVDEAFRAIRPWAEGHDEYAALVVADTGCGMPPEVRERIFDPFFTTKEQGKGTGLGLSTVLGIVTQHGGMVEVESEPGKGTELTVYLPLRKDGAAGPDEAREEELPPLEGGEGRVLLVADDDDDVRDGLVEVLEAAGFAVLAARDGKEAVELFRRYGERVDLVLLDVVMPHMNGREAAERIRGLRPDVPVLFASGYSGDSLGERIGMPADAEIVEKPFVPSKLVQTLRGRLEGESREGGDD